MECNKLSSATLSFSSEEDLEDADLIIFGIQAPPAPEEEEADNDDKSDEGVDKESVPEPLLSGVVQEIDDKVGGLIKDAMKENYKTFKNGAKAGEAMPTLRVLVPGEKAKKYILLGLGNEGKDAEEGLMVKLGKTIASKCDGEKTTKCMVTMPLKLFGEEGSMSDLSTGFYSSLYSDNRYRTGDKVKVSAKDLESVTIVSEGVDVIQAEAAVTAGKGLASGIYLTKDIVNAPHNVLNSESLASVAEEIAKESNGRITCTILEKEECEKRGMGAYLGVARGSETAPKFIHLTYTPKDGNASKKIGIVGKGLLFDTGGYNIKTAMMELMKFDCGGAAAVLGAARAVGHLAPDDVEAHFVVAACENMINEKAYVPSDILTASNGKTIEIVNTDAEGRLTLADALVYADKEVGCKSIIELSTLTGACMVALGKKVAGVWTDSDELAKELECTTEKTWRMPLEKEYNDQLKSNIADMTNCGTRYGGSITAALFLQNFVSDKKPFAHIDIAGPVWDDSATGYGARLVTEWVLQQGKKGN
eukprot:CAMPEP_0184855614 /NCGR_PEP_ID=MMETSP0580-20130426/800_1 /TAXON_ID=1118495 /ORGANISM="Dactyliosolen fragilissimus" /LENGTH=532 /DNA_ID=CAMNT_0027350167 /DNA_START=144 /DNA_END=1742 /DNA_ORIENTATION=+